MKKELNKIKEDYKINKDFYSAIKKIEFLANFLSPNSIIDFLNTFDDLKEFHYPIVSLAWKDNLKIKMDLVKNEKNTKEFIKLLSSFYSTLIKRPIYQKNDCNLIVELSKKTFGEEFFYSLEKSFYGEEKNDIKGLLNYQLIGNTDRKEWIEIHSERLREDWQGHYYEKQINEIIDEVIKEIS